MAVISRWLDSSLSDGVLVSASMTPELSRHRHSILGERSASNISPNVHVALRLLALLCVSELQGLIFDHIGAVSLCPTQSMWAEACRSIVDSDAAENKAVQNSILSSPIEGNAIVSISFRVRSPPAPLRHLSPPPLVDCTRVPIYFLTPDYVSIWRCRPSKNI